MPKFKLTVHKLGGTKVITRYTEHRTATRNFFMPEGKKDKTLTKRWWKAFKKLKEGDIVEVIM